jgi:hypothetical protein
MENFDAFDPPMAELINNLKFKLCNDNYDVLISKGIDLDEMKERGMDIVPVINTLREMILLFLEVEEYEKCQNIKQIIDEYEYHL